MLTSNCRARRRVLSWTTGILLLAVPASAEDQQQVITGEVDDSAGHAVAGASVTPWDNDHPLLKGATRTDSTGKFQVFVPVLPVQRVALEVSANGYDLMRRTIQLEHRPSVEPPPIVLRRSKAIVVDSATVMASANGATKYIDVFLRNANPTDQTRVASLRVVGSATATPGETCVDAGPSVTLKLADVLDGPGPSPAVHGTLTVESYKAPGQPERLSVQASGELVFHKCGISAIRMTLPYPLGFAPGEQSRVRVEVPANLTLSAQHLTVGWQPVSVGVQLDSGLLVERTL